MECLYWVLRIILQLLSSTEIGISFFSSTIVRATKKLKIFLDSNVKGAIIAFRKSETKRKE
jgi:hypothetical protein